MSKEILNVLMVEDNEFDAELNQEQLKLLENYDCIIKIVKDKDVYINEISSPTLPDLILCDYNLPMFNGMDALNELNSRNLLVPFIFVTGTMQEEIAADAIKAGAWDYVVKDRLFRLPLAIKGVLELKKEREIAKKAEEKIFRLIESIDQTSMQVYITDQNNIIEYVNKKVCEVTGYSSEYLIGKNAELFGLEENEPEVQETIRSCIKNGEGFKGELIGRYKDYNLCYELVTITPIKNENNKIASFIFVKEDITERKKLEENLKKSFEDLQILNKELVFAKDKAEQSNKLKQAFLNNMSHEIRTPLNAIVGFSQLLSNASKLNKNSIDEFTNIIVDSSNQLLSIVDDVLQVASIETGENPVRKQLFDINELFDHLYSIYLPQAKRKSLEFSVIKGVVNEPVFVETDKGKLEQILTNLLNNALRFTQKGSVCLEYNISDNKIIFLIEDTGIGIEKKNQEIIFERFRQAVPEIHISFGGMGLGLSISKSYVELLGGTIKVESEIDQGSVFVVELPYYMSAEKIKNTESNNKIKTKRPLKIIVAEDEINNFILLDSILSESDNHILHAVNGIKVLELMKQYSDIDLILMDLKMPVMDGITTFKKVKESNPDIPIIAQSAYASKSDIQNCLDLGFSGYITKPIKIKKLIQTINEIVK